VSSAKDQTSGIPLTDVSWSLGRLERWCQKMTGATETESVTKPEDFNDATEK